MKYDKKKIINLLKHYKKSTFLVKKNPQEIMKNQYLGNKLNAKETVIIFNEIFKFMGEKSTKILKNDFLHNNTYWWKKHYTHSTYFRYKKNAITEFLEYL